MNLQVQFKPEAVSNLKQLDKPIAQRILNKINWLAANFDKTIPERLSSELKQFYKLRIGDWRVLYTHHHGILMIHMIGHRREIYKN